MKLEQAQTILFNAAKAIGTYTKFISDAGSVRRKCPEVGDLEIVCVPDTESDLFGGGTIRSMKFCSAVEKLGLVIKGKPTGRYMQIELPEGINLDLFMPQKEDLYRQLAIRTGSAEFSQRLAQAWRAKGWCGTKDGLRLMKECEKDGKVWRCVEDNPTLPPVWSDEEHFFTWLGLKYVQPENR